MASDSSRFSHEPPAAPPGRSHVRFTWLASATVLIVCQLGFLGTFTSAAGDLFRFLTLLTLQFCAWAVALRAAGRAAGRRSDAPLLAIGAVAVVLRLLALPAGLDTSTHSASFGRELTVGSERPLELTSGYQPFLLYDNDVWRYLFDGSLLAHGISPYLFTPHQIDGTAELAPAGAGDPSSTDRIDHYVETVLESDRFTDVFDRTSYRDVRTVYPPLAQLLFALSFHLSAGGVFWWKLLVVACDFMTCLLLLRLARGSPVTPTFVLVAWAWNPLVIKEFAGSGHVDAILVTLLVASVTLAFDDRRATRCLAPVALACAALIKPTALAIAPALFWRVPLIAWGALPVLGVLAWWPLRTSLPAFFTSNRFFAREWEFNSGLWRLVRDAAAQLLGLGEVGAVDLANALYAAALLLCGAVVLWRLRPTDGYRDASGRTTLDAVTLLLAATVILGPVVNPWYVLWALPFAAMVGARSWLLFSALVCLSYLHYLDASTPWWSLLLQHGGLLAALVFEIRRRRHNARAAA